MGGSGTGAKTSVSPSPSAAPRPCVTSWDRVGVSLLVGLQPEALGFLGKVWGTPCHDDSGTSGPLGRLHTTQLPRVVAPLCLMFTFRRVPVAPARHDAPFTPGGEQVVSHKRICR